MPNNPKISMLSIVPTTPKQYPPVSRSKHKNLLTIGIAKFYVIRSTLSTELTKYK